MIANDLLNMKVSVGKKVAEAPLPACKTISHLLNTFKVPSVYSFKTINQRKHTILKEQDILLDVHQSHWNNHV